MIPNKLVIIWWFEREPDGIRLASLKLAYVNASQVHSGASEKFFVVLQKIEVSFGCDKVGFFCSCAVIFCWDFGAFFKLESFTIQFL